MLKANSLLETPAGGANGLGGAGKMSELCAVATVFWFGLFEAPGGGFSVAKAMFQGKNAWGKPLWQRPQSWICKLN